MQARCAEGSSAITVDSCKRVTVLAMTIHTASCFGIYECFSSGNVYRSVVLSSVVGTQQSPVVNHIPEALNRSHFAVLCRI